METYGPQKSSVCVRMYGSWKSVAILLGVKEKNDGLILCSSFTDSKHLYIPLSAHPLTCLYAASLMHFPSHAGTT